MSCVACNEILLKKSRKAASILSGLREKYGSAISREDLDHGYVCDKCYYDAVHSSCVCCKKRLKTGSTRRSASSFVTEITSLKRTDIDLSNIASSFLCDVCYQQLKRGKSFDATVHEGASHSITEEEVVEYIEANLASMGLDACLRIASAVGSYMKGKLRKFAEDHRGTERTISNLLEYNNDNYLKQCHPVISRFIRSVSSAEAPPHLKVRAVESLCQLNHRNFVTPFSFKQHLLVSTLTCSALTQEIISACLPAGSRVTVQAIQGRDRPVVIPPHVDIVCAFDNQQILGKHHRLLAFKENPVSTCTAVLHAVYADSVTQIDCNLSLETTLGKGHSKTSSPKHMGTAIELSEEEHQLVAWELKQLYTELLPQIKKERSGHFAQYLFEMGRLLDQSDYNRSCLACLERGSEKGKQCKVCRAPMPTASEASEHVRQKASSLRSRLSWPGCESELLDPAFAHVRSEEQLAPVLVNDDPIFSLPNSYEGCKKIVRELGKRLSVARYGGTKQYVVLACDGQPYSLLKNIIQNHILCSGCGCELWSTSGFDDHNRKKHQGRANADFEFAWILLQMGYGHLEMNYMKTCIKLFWDSFLSRFAWVLNFRSEKAQNAAKKSSDTHKSFELLNTARYSLFLELINLFFDEKADNDKVTYEEFLVFVTQNEKPNVLNSWHFVAHVLQPIFLFRAGVRKNNHAYISLGLKLSLAIFYATPRATNYQNIVLHHLVLMELLPAEIQQFIRRTQSLGSPGEGMDFRLEEKNAIAKRNLKSSATPQDWLKVYRNLDDLEKVRTTTFQDIGLIDPKFRGKKRKRQYNLTTEKVRATLRMKKFFEALTLTDIFANQITAESAVLRSLERGYARLEQRTHVAVCETDIDDQSSDSCGDQTDEEEY